MYFVAVGKNSADRFLLVNLMDWVSQNPPPAHLFFISGDTDFAGILHKLRMNNYNVLLATPTFASEVFHSAATIIWQWSSILKGNIFLENILTILLMVCLVLGMEIIRCLLINRSRL